MSNQENHTRIELELVEIVVDETLQPRHRGLDPDPIATLRETFEHCPSVRVVDRDGEHVLVDDCHRLEAATQLGRTMVRCEVHPVPGDGDLQALAFAFNLVHGKPLTLTDDREEAERPLYRSPQLSDRTIAKCCGLSCKTVGKLRAELEATAEFPQLERRVGADGKTRPVAAKKQPSTGRQATAKATASHSLHRLHRDPSRVRDMSGFSVINALVRGLRVYTDDCAQDGLGEAISLAVRQVWDPTDWGEIAVDLVLWGAGLSEAATDLAGRKDLSSGNTSAVAEQVA